MIFFYEITKLLSKHSTMDYKKSSSMNSIAKGIPVPSGFTKNSDCASCKACEKFCPTKAIRLGVKSEIEFDYGACIQCGLCVEVCEKEILENSGFVYTFALNRQELIINYKNGDFQPEDFPVSLNVVNFRKLTRKQGFNFRSIVAGGNNSVECEINASFNNVFDCESEGVRSVASPKHADAIIYSGPVSENMKVPLAIAWNVMPEPKALIANGTEAVSGGLFTLGERPKEPDLFISGDPPRPDVFLSAYRLLMGRLDFSFQRVLKQKFQKLRIMFIEKNKKQENI